MEKCTRHVSTGHHDLDITPAKQSLTMFKQPQHLQTASHPCTCHPLFSVSSLGSMCHQPGYFVQSQAKRSIAACYLQSSD